jgi:hypothetical protein
LFFPINRVLIQKLPVDAVVIASTEAAMDYWEERMELTLEQFLSLTGVYVLVDTQREDPVFSMDDIPLYKWSP